MFTFKKPLHSIKPALILGTLCLSTLVGAVAISSSVEAQRGQSFGLGMSSSSTTAGATRSPDDKPGLPRVLLLVPPDGARTLSARPTLYWYVAFSEDEKKLPFKMRLFLRDNPSLQAKALFDVKGSGKEPGLYKFTLPEKAPSLVEGKVQRLQLRWELDSQILNLSANVLLDKDPRVVKAVSEARTDLDKARIYAKEHYWYDALDAYSTWLEAHPKDTMAIKERDALLSEGLKSSETITEPVLNELLTKLNKNLKLAEFLLP